MQNVFLLKMLSDDRKKEAYEKLKETNPDINELNFDELYYETLHIYGKNKGWNNEYMSKVIPNKSNLLEEHEYSKIFESDNFESQDFSVTLTKRNHIGNKIRKPKDVTAGRKNNQSKNNKSKIASGILGEKIVVLDYEKKKLKKLGIDKEPIWCTKTDDPSITYDGLGYDVVSYNEKDEPIYI